MAPSITRRFVLRMKFISSISRKMGIILSVVFKEAGAQHEWTTRKSENAAALNTELFSFFLPLFELLFIKEEEKDWRKKHSHILPRRFVFLFTHCLSSQHQSLAMKVLQKPRLLERYKTEDLAMSMELRLRSFTTCPGGWPLRSDIPSSLELAHWGFFYEGKDDHIRYFLRSLCFARF